MISHIEIKDFAVIKNLDLDLYPGLNVITGETGAGKSVIIEAISMALGGRADTDYIRHGCDKSVISLIVDLNDQQYSIKREIYAGKSLCRLNGEIVSVSELSAFCKGIVDIHGQYDHQSLLNSDNHIKIVDAFGGEEINKAKNLVSSLYEKYANASKELMLLNRQLSDSERQKDYLKFEIDEISRANLRIGEDVSLEDNISIMEHSEAIFDGLSKAYGNIAGDDRGIYYLLGGVLSELDAIKDYSGDINAIYHRLNDIYYEIEDIYHDIRNQKDKVNFAEGELDAAISRLETINKLKKKYGPTIEDILAYLETSSKKLQLFDDSDNRINVLENTIIKLKADYNLQAEKLSALRKETGLRLSDDINRELSELNFSNAQFGVSFSDIKPAAEGIDAVEFMISTNKGEEKKSLSKIISGGELSRIMLALKRIIGDIDDIPTMIFDEIDTGISGATASVVGNKLKSIASNHQIVCITHLPQIAALGNHHYKIYKTSDEFETHTNVVLLDDFERTEEVARLLSGAEITDSARAQADELLGKMK